MSKFPKLSATKRTLLGRKVKQLRRQGLIPANLFGKKINSLPIQIEAKAFAKLFAQVGETGIIDITVDGKSYPSLVAGQALDPVSGSLLHVDFHNVSLTEKVTATIPLELIGEAPAVKEAGGVLAQNLYEIEVEALPTNLPESFTIDLSSLAAIGDSITVADISVPQGVTLTLEPETVIVSIVEPAPEEVAEAAPAESESAASTDTTEQTASAQEQDAAQAQQS